MSGFRQVGFAIILWPASPRFRSPGGCGRASFHQIRHRNRRKNHCTPSKQVPYTSETLHPGRSSGRRISSTSCLLDCDWRVAQNACASARKAPRGCEDPSLATNGWAASIGARRAPQGEAGMACDSSWNVPAARADNVHLQR